MNIQNNYHDQPLKVRVKALPSPADFADDKNIVLADFENLSAGEREADNQDFVLAAEQSNDYSKGGTCGLKLTACNSSSARSSWASMIFRYDRPLDLTSHRVPGVWVFGDGSGALLDLRLKDTGNSGRDYFIRLDFTGWQYFELTEPAGIEIFDTPLPEYAMRSLRAFNYGKVSYIRIFLTDAPPDTTVTCYLSRIEALKESPTTIRHPSFTAHGKTAVFPVTLEDYHYLEYWGEAKARVYDENGNAVSETAPQGVLPSVRTGMNTIEFRCEALPDERKQARIEIITLGEAVPDKD